jgi:hypothetical protein
MTTPEQSLSDHPDYRSHERFVELAVLHAVRAGQTVPVGVVTPPIAGRCGLEACDRAGTAHSHCVHCGTAVAERDGLRWHTPDLHDGDGLQTTLTDNERPVRLLVAHCADCQDGADCQAGVRTPRGDGFCEAFEG